MALLITILFGFCSYLWLQLRSLKKRIATLEAPTAGLEESTETAKITPTSDEAPEPSDGPWTPPPDGKPALKKKLIAAAPNPTPVATGAAPQNPRSFVFRQDLLTKTTRWLGSNWFYVLAAASLALAGVFLIQYSVESGLLSPPLRVVGGMSMGGALLFTGEFLRRRGSDEDGSLAYLPSTFAAGGFITLFASFWGAYALYALIGPQLAFALLAIVGIAAIACGWFYGPLVSVVGTIGAIATPFLLGGGSDSAHLLMPYFAAVAAGALTIDSLKRWAWLSVLALVLATGATSAIYFATDAKQTYMLTLIGLTVLATVIPARSIVPKFTGTAITPALITNMSSKSTRVWPDFPPRLTLAMLIVVSAAVFWVYSPTATVFWLCFAMLGGLLLLTFVWMAEATALEDAVLPPSLALLGFAALSSPRLQGPFGSFPIGSEQLSETNLMPPTLALGGLALAVSLFATWRSLRQNLHPVSWAAMAVTFSPIMAIALEYFWTPQQYLGRPLWAVLLIVVAAALTWAASIYAKRDGENRLRVSMAAASAIVMISFALTTLLSDAALTVALALATAATAYIARSQNLQLMRHLVTVGAIVVSSRLIFYPGILWAADAAFLDLLIAYVASIALLAGARHLLPLPSSAATLVLHSACWSLGGIFGTLLLFRAAEHFDVNSELLVAGLVGSIWLILAFTQLYRLQSEGWIKTVRIGLSTIYLIIAGLVILLLLSFLNPLMDSEVGGLPLLNPILVAYGLPAALLGAMSYKLQHLARWVRVGFGGSAILLALLTVGLLIRHFWRRPDLKLPGIEPAELYTYTVVMMLGSGLLLIAAIAKKHKALRSAALIGLGLTAAKVFLIDASGLTGLIRVFAFLGLGLTLAGLAWLNRKFGDEPALTSPNGPDTQAEGGADDTKNVE